ncbi:TetR/AcrR family transcriptional regulator [Sulfurovum sp.]|uniref:TetR/AcrR family transcriptional regulator n=1 Tax=Sulfurovum sp. TaxID=1969726 RepID=UPI00286812EF|nr:TetR/AcrR family transcriptional regulator [Sulfurovum sp.]
MGTEKREKILKTAMSLFVEKGIQGTATSLIAKEAGVATGTLFHHFKTKEDLVHALYNSIFDSILEYQERYFNPKTSVYERLRQIWKLDIEWGTSHVEYTHFMERYSFFYYASELAINEACERFKPCMNTFNDAINQKIMKIDDVNYVSDHYIWNIRMNTIYFIDHPEQCTPENIEKTFEIYWNGISHT